MSDGPGRQLPELRLRFDSVLGHCVAEACVLQFVQDVAAQLRAELG